LKRIAVIMSGVILAVSLAGCSSAPTRGNYETADDKEAYEEGYLYTSLQNIEYYQARFPNGGDACLSMSLPLEESAEYRTSWFYGCFDQFKEQGF